MVDSKGNHTERDLVQFVEFSKFSNNGQELAKEVLEQLPRQVSEYFQLMNISPDDVANSYKGKSITIQKTTLKGLKSKKKPKIPIIDLI